MDKQECFYELVDFVQVVPGDLAKVGEAAFEAAKSVLDIDAKGR